MSFWIKVDVSEKGSVTATTYDLKGSGDPGNRIRSREGATVSQALRKLAQILVYAKAENLKP